MKRRKVLHNYKVLPMKRLIAVLRCVHHAFLPPFLERWLTGDVHYYKSSKVAVGHYDYSLMNAYLSHMRLNLVSAYDIAVRPHHMRIEDREFHGIN